jgi:DHA2 family multidrug resistance protein
MGVLAVLALWIYLPDGGRERHVRLDWPGFLTLVVAMICMQLALDRGDRLDWFESIEVIVETVVGGIAFYLFIAHSLTRTGRPFLDLRHLLDRNYATGLLLLTIYGMMNFLPMIMLPPMLQDLLGFPNAIIGTLLAWRGGRRGRCVCRISDGVVNRQAGPTSVDVPRLWNPGLFRLVDDGL